MMTTNQRDILAALVAMCCCDQGSLEPETFDDDLQVAMVIYEKFRKTIEAIEVENANNTKG